MADSHVQCDMCYYTFHRDYAHTVYMQIPTDEQRADNTFDAEARWESDVPSMDVCMGCISATQSIVVFGAGAYFFSDASVPRNSFRMRLSVVRHIMERLQYYSGNKCVTCNTLFDAGEQVAVCVTCMGSVHAVGCIVDAHGYTDKEGIHETRISITRGVCIPCENKATLSEDIPSHGPESVEEAGSPGVAGGSCKKRKLTED